MGQWEFELLDTVGDALGSLSVAKSRKVTWYLDDAAKASFTIDGLHPQAELISETATDLRVYDPDHTVRFRGRMGSSNDDVSAAGHISNLTAVEVYVYCNCHWIAGTLTTIGTTTITVYATRTGPYDTVLDNHDVIINLNTQTSYIRGSNKTPISLANLKTGDHVGIVFAANGFFHAPGFNPNTATFTAKRIHDWQHQPTPNASSDANAAATTPPNQ